MSQTIVVVGGQGYWGKNLVRCFDSLARVIVVDQTSTFHKTLDDIGKIRPDGIVIATPPETHCDLALEALERTGHVLIEKPMTTNLRDAKTLEPYAEQIMVDHTFLYVPEFMYIKNLLIKGDLGDPLYAYSDRLNLGKFQPCGVIWDLGPHDLALFQWLFEAKAKIQQARQFCVRYYRPDVARLDVQFGQVETHLHMSWVHPTKVRRTTIVCKAGMIVYDMMAEEKVKIYHPSREAGQRLVTGDYGDYLMGYRGGDIVSPSIPQHEPLKAMCNEFLTFCKGGSTRSDYEIGQDVVEILEKATHG